MKATLFPYTVSKGSGATVNGNQTRLSYRAAVGALRAFRRAWNVEPRRIVGNRYVQTGENGESGG